MVCNTDVFNGYIREAGDEKWRQLLRPDTLPAADYDPRPDNRKILRAKFGGGTNNGTFGTRIAPSDPRIIYTGWNGYLYRSENGGRSFARTSLDPKAFLSDSGPSRRFNRTIDIHPGDPAQILVGTNGDGCYASKDGRTFAQLDLPDTKADFKNVPGKYLVAWGLDGSAWVHVFGVGLYHAAAGIGGQFLFAGGPATASCLVASPDGAVYICEFRTSAAPVRDALHVLQDGRWTRRASTTNADQVAVDPFDPAHLVWVDENSAHWWESHDGGTRAVDLGNEWRGQGESDWLSNRSKATYPAQLLFDPVVRGRLWIAEGVGINSCDLANAPGEKPVLNDRNAGISEFVATCGLSSAVQEKSLLGVMDKGVWRVDENQHDGWSYCPQAGRPGNASGVAHLRSIDNALDDPDFVVGLFHQDGTNGWSEDWGRSFTAFPPPPTQDRWLPGGDCAVSRRENIIIAQGNRGGAWWTKSGGRRTEDWHPVEFGGYSPVSSWLNASYVHRDCIAADKTRPGVFAAVVSNIYKLPDNRDATGRDIAGLWVNRNGGEGEWERRVAGVLVPKGFQHHTVGQFWQAKLAYVPGRSGELLYANCEGSNARDPLVWLRDDGAELIALPPRRVMAFDFGKPAPGQDRPAVYFYGSVEGVRGLYVSFDWFKTDPVLLARFPNSNFDQVSSGLGLVGDRNRFGRCYLGFVGSGWIRADMATKAVETEFPLIFATERV